MIKFLFLGLLCSCSSVFYYPNNNKYYQPKQFNIEHDEHFFDSLDGTKLHSWYLKPKDKTKGVVLFFHGNAQNLTAHFANLAWLTQHGYGIFIFDYRGYGQSEGVAKDTDLQKDAQAALTKVYEEYIKNKKRRFIVFGQSLGGAVAMRAIFDFKHKDQIDLVVMDSTFSSYKSIAFDRLKSSWITFLFSPLAYLIISNKTAPHNFIAKLSPTPLLVIHGIEDKVVPYKFGEEIYNLANSPKEMWSIEQADHMQGFFVLEQKYQKLLVDYFNKINLR